MRACAGEREDEHTCVGIISQNTRVSVFLGRLFSTSALSRRNMKGRRILCSCVMSRCFCSASSISRLNQSSNWSEEEKTSGSKKLRRAQSSCRLFWGRRRGEKGGRSVGERVDCDLVLTYYY